MPGMASPPEILVPQSGNDQNKNGHKKQGNQFFPEQVKRSAVYNASH